MPKSQGKDQHGGDKEQELINDLQRVRADFENYRKQVEFEKSRVADAARAETAMKLLPVIDNIERAIAHAPADLSNNSWAQGVIALGKNLEKSLSELGLTRINAKPGEPFNHDLHEAVMMEDGEGEHEVIAEELRPGYVLNGQVIRPSMVKVTRS
jgi:molecular chaperone GrpE